jgi:hypothetical protein
MQGHQPNFHPESHNDKHECRIASGRGGQMADDLLWIETGGVHGSYKSFPNINSVSMKGAN